MKYDVVVIGSGPGGYVSAIRASQLGKKVCVIEKSELGGTCLNKGCIPTKALVACANVLRTVRKSDKFGIHSDNVSFNWKEVQERKNRIVKQLSGGIRTLFKSYGIDLIKGKAKNIQKECVKVVTDDNKESIVEGTNIIIATGSIPATIPNISVDGEDIITSNEVLELEKVPESILIVGGGVIGLEFGCLLNCFGTKAVVVEMLDRILPTEDNEISNLMKQYLKKDGIDIKTGTVLKNITKKNGKIEATVVSGDNSENIITDKVLIATGRIPSSGGLELQTSGIKIDRNRILANDKMQTNVERVFAIGDVTGGVLLAHVASAEGIVAAENITDSETNIDYKIIPNCIYTIPEVASVGLSEDKAKNLGYETRIGRFPFIANGRALTLDETRGLVKIVIDKKTDALLGIHIIGAEATELIMQGSLGLKLETIPEEFKRIIYAHPTLSESIYESMHDAYKEAIDLPRK